MSSRHRLAVALTFAAAAPLAAQDGERIRIHGFLTQGAAIADTLPILGIPKAGTTDYRAAALQFRARVTDDRSFVVQLSHKRVGTSVISGAQDDVELDWAFFQQNYGTGNVRIGRFAMPTGIYNEIRDAGVVLPFFRAPFNQYTEGVETMDGVRTQQTLFGSSKFPLEVHAYAGGYDFKVAQAVPTGRTLVRDRVDRAVGGQLWLRTPIQGVRFGYGAQRISAPQFSLLSRTARGDGWLGRGSVDVSLEKVIVRAEATRFQFEQFRYDAQLLQVGLKPTEQLGLWWQLDNADVRTLFPIPGVGPRPVDYDYARSQGVAVNWAFSPQFIARVEGHFDKGYLFDVFRAPIQPALSGNYYIASVAVSF